MTLIRSLRTGASRIKEGYFELELNEGESVMRDIILTLDRFGDQALLLGRVGENRATGTDRLKKHIEPVSGCYCVDHGQAAWPGGVSGDGETRGRYPDVGDYARGYRR